MIPVGRLAPGNQWDQNLLDRLFDNTLHPTGLTFQRIEGFPKADGCVLIIPGRYWATGMDVISEAVAEYEWLLLMRCGDEEDEFDVGEIRHPNARFWVQTPRADRDYGDARLFGVGFPPHFNDLKPDPPHKDLDVFLSAQNTHDRRRQCFAQLPVDGSGRFVRATEGFTAGMPHHAYMGMMRDAKTAPAPSGAVSPDSFRLYEALEAHTVPIADDVSPAYDSRGYWRSLFPDVSFPVLTDYQDLPGYLDDVLRDWPRIGNRVTAWWMRQKRRYAEWMVEDLKALGAL